MANQIYRYLTLAAKDFIFFSGDVQTTTIAVAITGSLCFSIAWAIFHLVLFSHSAKVVQVSNRKTSSNVKKTTKERCTKKCQLTSSTSSDDDVINQPIIVSEDFTLPCVRCSVYCADDRCRYLTCAFCCFSPSSCLCHHVSTKSKCRPYLVDRKPTDIDLSKSNLSKCPRRLGYTGAHLVLLNLSQNKLQELPKDISCLQGLQDLNLQKNSLSFLPESLGSLINLRNLIISKNSLCCLPDSVAALSNLKHLDLEENNLSSLPGTFGNLYRLKTLLIGKNNLTRIPASVFHLQRLKKLFLNNNPIESLPDDIQHLISLQKLDVSHCHLIKIPDTINRCSHLQYLNLSDNRLLKLPVQIGFLCNLKVLKVTRNFLRYLPSTLCLDKLTFEVSDNPLLVHGSEHSTLMSSSPSNNSFPSLMELVLRFITSNSQSVSYDIDILPAHIKDILQSRQYCSGCGNSFFLFWSSYLTFQQHNQLSIPFLSRICSPHKPQSCQ